MISVIISLAISDALMKKPAQAQLKKLDPVSFVDVSIKDRFWTPRQEVNRTATVEHSLKMLDKFGNYLVMKLAAEGKREGYKGLLFTDSDLYKTLEGIAYTLHTHPDPKLDKRVDEIIAMIAAAQMEDGYLNTWFQVTRPNDRFKNLRDWHELYCAGHMFEAAAAHYQATGKRNFLDIALKLAERIHKEFGPNGKPGYCGHPEIELALVKLWRVTGDKKWFELGRLMTERRGTHYFAAEHKTPEARYDGTYWQDDVPIEEHREIKGHAVRAAYLMSGVADIARETHDPELIKMLGRVWRNTTEKRIFVTGGIGPSASNEGFTVDYDLPNLTAYQETCASIAMALWGHRMALLYADARYMDPVETSLYNALLSGIALDGKKFFYVNPLASMGGHHRREWYECACCPPNVLRSIASIGGYAYATSKDSLYVNLYAGGKLRTKLDGKPVAMDVKTDYPWDGKVEMQMIEPAKFALRLRVPDWSRTQTLKVNGVDVTKLNIESGYIVLDRTWKAKDRVVLDLPMPVEQLEAHPKVRDDVGRAVVRRGPLIYCLEQVDNASPVEEVVIPKGASFKPTYRKDLLGGIVAIEADAEKVSTSEWETALYQLVPKGEKVKATLIPYGFWDNRKAGRMEVWIPTSPPPGKATGPEGKAAVTVSFKSGNAQPWGINDGLEPKSSGEQPNALFHFWPHKGGEEWAQYTWKKPLAISGVRIYWFDDTGRGECRLPQSWRLQYLVGNAWKDVALKEAPISLDKWCETRFSAIETTAMRLLVKQKDGWASGIHEWQILLDE